VTGGCGYKGYNVVTHGDPKGHIFHTYFLEHVSPSFLFLTSELTEIFENSKGVSRNGNYFAKQEGFAMLVAI